MLDDATLVMDRVAWCGDLGDRPHRNARSGDRVERPRRDRTAAHVNSITMLVGRATVALNSYVGALAAACRTRS